MYGPHLATMELFFGRNNKSRSSSFRNFILSKYHVLTDLRILSDIFCHKICHFQLKLLQLYSVPWIQYSRKNQTGCQVEDITFLTAPPRPLSLEILGFSLNLGNSISSKPPLFVLLKKYFLKTLLLEFLIFLLYSWSQKFPRKQSSTPGISQNCVQLDPLEISRPKQRPLEIPHYFFLVTLRNSTSFLINTPKFQKLFL